MARILVIDDEPQILSLAATILAIDGHDVAVAADAETALAALDADPFDVVLTDLVLPGTETFSLIRQIRGVYPGVRVVAMSGGGGYFLPEACLSVARGAGADSILRKPFTVEALLEAVSPAALAAARAESAAMPTTEP